MTLSDTRDFYGYGSNLSHAEWSNNARVAISFVLNLEEGAELAISDGDERNEVVCEIVLETQCVPDLAMESYFEYGARVGFGEFSIYSMNIMFQQR